MPNEHLPVGVITYLFTDIAGSTRLLHELGSSYGDVLNTHHRLMREAIDAHGGIEVSTEGDSFFVAFTRPVDAVGAAVSAQRALSAYASEAGIDLRVRMGLHTGDAVIVGDNYGGIDVHRAARVSSVAHGGQIVLTEPTRTLVEASFGGETRVEDLGEHRLKDLDGPEHLYQVCAEGLPTHFPPPRSLGLRATNIPTALTPFVARDVESSEILALLKTSRLVTLTGPGGTGKTRLGLEVSTQALMDFDDGVFVVFLAAVDDPDLVPSTIAQALGLQEQGLRPISEVLKNYLASRNLLLFLDNFEQLIARAPFVSDLLQSARGLKILVTSRAPLRVQGEQEYPVPPMRVPHLRGEQLPEALAGFESVTLFVQRARAVKPDFEVTENNAGALAEICRRLDGLPLAIELAAARTRLMSPEEITARLDASLRFLSSSARDLPERQRTLRGAIHWSYDLLSEPLQTFFERLAVFAGSWSFGAADVVCNPDEELGLDTLDALEGLTESNLVRRFEGNEGETRFRMLQTIREYAVERLNSSEEAGEIHGRHARFFLELVNENAPQLTSVTESLRRLEAEHDNIRGVLKWAMERPEIDLGLQLSSSVWRFWMIRSHLAEGRRWLTELLSAPDPDVGVANRARALMALGSITYWQNDFDATRVNYLEALVVFRDLGDKHGIAEALYNSGFLALIDNDAAGARPSFTESLALSRELKDDRGVANAIWGLSMCAVEDRDLQEANRLAAEAEEIYLSLDDWFGTSVTRFVFYQVARYGNDFDEARRLLRVAMDERRALENSAFASSLMEQVAIVESLSGRHEEAALLGGAIEATEEEYGGGSPPALINRVDFRSEARRVLGDERVAHLWDEGRAMSWEEGLAYARKLVENVTDGSS